MITMGGRGILATGRGQRPSLCTDRSGIDRIPRDRGSSQRRWTRWPQVQVPAVPAAPRSGLWCCSA